MPEKPTTSGCPTCGRPCPDCGSVCPTCAATFRPRTLKQVYCSRDCWRRRPRHIDRFWSRVAVTGGVDGCWEWQGYRNRRGYGQTSYEGRMMPTHRLSWELAYGPIPDGLLVRHSCDNPPCVRVDHLSLGTSADNKHDSVSRGRHAHGERAGNAKLTAADVLEIRRRYIHGDETHRSLAAEFGVANTRIHAILTGRSWKHLDPQQ